MSALTQAPLLNVRKPGDAVELKVGFGETVMLLEQELNPGDGPFELTLEVGEGIWDVLCRPLTWIGLEVACEDPSDLPRVHSPSAVDRIVSAIRLVTDEPVAAPLIWTDWRGPRTSDRFTGYSVVSSFPERWAGARAHGLLNDDPDECELGQKQWSKVQQMLTTFTVLPPQGSRLELALRRYDMAKERSDPVDGIIDLFVALEALLVNDDWQRDKGDWLAKRAKLVLGDSEPVSDIADHYLARNKIVHGKTTLYDANAVYAQLLHDARRILKTLLVDTAKRELVMEDATSKN